MNHNFKVRNIYWKTPTFLILKLRIVVGSLTLNVSVNYLLNERILFHRKVRPVNRGQCQVFKYLCFSKWNYKRKSIFIQSDPFHLLLLSAWVLFTSDNKIITTKMRLIDGHNQSFCSGYHTWPIIVNTLQIIPNHLVHMNFSVKYILIALKLKFNSAQQQ